MILAVSGKFPGDYEDGRFSSPPDNLAANLGRMPVVVVGDDTVGQSLAINYFLAAENGLMGASNLEAAKILSIAEHIREMRTKWSELVPYGTEPSEEALDKWFDGGATDTTGVADRAGQPTRYLKWWMGRIEQTLGDAGFAVGSALSLADLLLYNSFAEFLRDEEAGELAQWKREPFGSKSRTDAAIANCPKLSASIAQVAANANIQQWLSTRGVQMF